MGPGRIAPGLIIVCNITIASVLVVGCVTTSPFNDRQHSADFFPNNAGFTKEFVRTGNFTLLTCQKIMILMI